MRLKYVNGVEVDLAMVLLGELVQGGNLPPKRRSGIAPEYQDDRPVCPKGREIGWSVVFQLFESKCWSGITNAQVPIARRHPQSLKRKHEIGRHGHLRHHVAEDLRRLMHGPVHVSNQASQPAKQMAATLMIQTRTRLLTLIFTTLLLSYPIHSKVALRGNPEGIRHSIEEREDCGDIHCFSYPRLGPTEISQLLHIFIHIVEQSAFRRAQACLFQIAIRDGLYCFIFGSLNTQEVCMRVQSIGTAIEPRYPARDRFLGSSIEVAFGNMDRVTELHYLAQKIGSMAEALQNAGHLLTASRRISASLKLSF